ncbi:MAG TPA: DUF1841 domain-containing protein [Nitrospina sp.]|jgi:hypothetical protein|nr:DUF1841 domain-containing protein [Nitrospina sp.]
MQFDKETQVRILRVASDRHHGRDIEELDSRIAHVMDLHPEFEEIWTMGEMAAYPQEINGQIVSPFVHTVLHTIVDSQIRTEQPEFVIKAFNKLREQGMEEHEVLHAIIAVYADLHFSSFRQGKPFDQLDYESRLGYLSFEDAEEN